MADGIFAVSEAEVRALPERLRSAQRVFDRTGGIHAAGLFDASGRIAMVREDVGRHNAVDKVVVGALVLSGRLPGSDRGLIVSGRSSFEILQKAAMAGFPVVVAVGAPSSPGGYLRATVQHDAGGLREVRRLQRLLRCRTDHPPGG